MANNVQLVLVLAFVAQLAFASDPQTGSSSDSQCFDHDAKHKDMKEAFEECKKETNQTQGEHKAMWECMRKKGPQVMNEDGTVNLDELKADVSKYAKATKKDQIQTAATTCYDNSTDKKPESVFKCLHEQMKQLCPNDQPHRPGHGPGGPGPRPQPMTTAAP